MNRPPYPVHRRVNWSLREILRGSDGVFTLYYNTPDGATEIRTRSVALTTPAYVAADLVRAAAPNASDALKCFDYPPVGAVTLAYPLSAIRDDRKAADGSLPGARAGTTASVLAAAWRCWSADDRNTNLTKLLFKCMASGVCL